MRCASDRLHKKRSYNVIWTAVMITSHYEVLTLKVNRSLGVVAEFRTRSRGVGLPPGSFCIRVKYENY